MEGINLSSSVSKQGRETSWFLTGSFFIVLVFFLLLSLWGGMQLYLRSLDDVFSQKRTLLSEGTQNIQREKVNRIAGLDARLTLAQDQIQKSVDTDKILSQLESAVIPNIRLTKYEFNKQSGFVLIEGETDDFKYIAQQISSFKTSGLSQNISVESLDRKEGLIQFSLKMTL